LGGVPSSYQAESIFAACAGWLGSSRHSSSLCLSFSVLGQLLGIELRISLRKKHSLKFKHPFYNHYGVETGAVQNHIEVQQNIGVIFGEDDVLKVETSVCLLFKLSLGMIAQGLQKMNLSHVASGSAIHICVF
jgi:hypothetical protein